MNADEPLLYSAEEIRSFLPSGWHLAGEVDGTVDVERAWDAKRRIWRITVLDNVDFDWPVEVKPADVARLGSAGANARMEALRRAMDKVYRERLG